jgi:hypothetical protein
MSGSYYIEMRFEMGPQAPGSSLENHLDEVAEALAEIPGVDGDIGVDLESGRVDVCITVIAQSRPEAIARAVAAARTAVHSAGGHTPDWEGMLAGLLDNDDYQLMSAPNPVMR